MAIELVELLDSRVWSGGVVTFVYRLTGTDDDAVALQYLMSHTDSFYEGLVRQTHPSIRPEYVDEITNEGRWLCEVRYGQYERPPVEESEIGTVRIYVDTTGGTAHVTQSENTSRYGSGTMEFDGAIGVRLNADGSQDIEGVDIVIPVFNVTVTKAYSKYNIPSLNEIYALTGKVNSSGFTISDSETGKSVSFSAGECLFNGAQVGNLRSDGGIEVSYSFSGSPNRSGLTIAGVSGISKKGWEYVWVYYYPSTNSSNQPVLKALNVFVEQVYEIANLNALDI